MRLTNLRRTVTTSLTIKEKDPRKQLVKVGQLKVIAKSYGSPRRADRSWTWSVYRRGPVSERTLPVSVKQSWPRLKKWPKSRKKQRLMGTVTVSYNLGLGFIKKTIKVYDRGPERVRGKRLNKYSVVSETTGIGRRGGKMAIVRKGSVKSQSHASVALVKRDIKRQVASIKGIKVRPAVYVVIRPKEGSARAKTKTGLKSLSAAHMDLKHRRKVFLESLRRSDMMFKELSKEISADPLSKFNRLPKEFRRSTRSHTTKDTKIEVRGYTKRVDAKPHALSEVLAHRLVRWWSKPPGAKKGRWQGVAFTLIRWGKARSTRPAYVPSYTVTDSEGKDIIFAVNTSTKTEEDVKEKLVQEQYDKLIYTPSPLKRARAELEKKARAWVKMLKRAPSIEERPWLNVARGEGTERTVKHQVRIVKWGFQRAYPAIHSDNKYRYLGGVILELRRRRGKRTIQDVSFDMVRPRTLKARKREGAVLLLRNRRKVGSYISAHKARNALRKMVNECVARVREGKTLT